MKLTLKLPLASCAALFIVLLAGAFGIWALNGALDTYATKVQGRNDAAHTVGHLSVQFKLQIQEWKNTLLRGKDPKQLEKYWGEFNRHEREMAKASAALLPALPDEPTRELVQRFAAAHAQMGRDYRKGYEAFVAAGFDPVAGDAAVKGMDREPAKLLDQAEDKVRKQAVEASAEATASARRATALALALMLSSVVGAGVAGHWFSRRLAARIDQAGQLAQRVAAGDLSRAVAAQGGDEIAELMRSLAAMQASLVSVVGSVRGNAQSVATASAQIAQGNQDLSQRTEAQASALEQTAATMHELGAAVHNSADNARQADQLARSASDAAVQGGTAVGEVVQTMMGINESSRKIAEIIGTIDGIAFQTNILALNAAVEAARAGEQGRGFAVVAGEVRSLAQRSAEAAKEIKSLIVASVERVEHGNALVDKAGAAMNELVGSIRRVTDIVGEISSASSEQANGVAQVGEAVSQMDQATQRNAALVEESAAAAASLKGQAQQLVEAVAVFKLASAS